MTNNVTGTFKTRRDADMAVERLVQEFGIERTDIFITAQGADNTVGIDVDGSDRPSGASGEEARSDGAHEGVVSVSIDLNDDAIQSKISAAFAEFNGSATADR
jgi:hypothetical protein